MMKKICFFLLLHILWIPSSWCQSKDQPPVFKLNNGSITEFLERKFQFPYALNTLERPCDHSFIVTSLNFQVGTDGQVVHAVVDSRTPKPLSAALLKALEQSNGQWIPRKVNGKTVESRTYAIPVICRKVDCQANTVDADSLANNLAALYEFQSGSQPLSQEIILLKPLSVQIYRPLK